MGFATDHAAAPPPRADERAGALSGALLPASYALVLALLAWPILSVAQPMLADYPNHLARLHVADALTGSDALARFYVRQGGLYPYLPFDVLVGLLSHLVGLEAAGRVFIVVAMAMPGLGTMVLSRVLHGRIGLWPIVSALFAYNLLLSWGLITFLFSLGVALMMFAGWIATASWRWPRRLAAFAVLSSLLFCLHPFAFSVLALLIGAWEAGQTRGLTATELKTAALRLCLTGLQFAPAIVLAQLVERTDVGSDGTAFGALSERLTAVLSPALFLLDLGEALLFAALAVAFVLACRQGMLALDRRMILPLAAAGIGALLMPALVSGVYLVHLRLPLAFVLLVIAAWQPRPVPRRTAVIALAALAALLLTRTTTIADRLVQADREVAELRAASAAIEDGARVLPVIGAARGGALRHHAYWHANAYLTIDRGAFYPLLFSMYNVGVQPGFAASASPATSPVPLRELDLPPDRLGPLGRTIREVYWRDWRRNFDYIVLYDFGEVAAAIPAGLTLVRRGAIFAIYRID
jgi:hypothetical protein